MIVQKFGGSSVADAKNILSVISIIQQAQKENELTAVVLSALAGTTDALLKTASLALSGNEEYLAHFKNIEQRHLSLVTDLMPADNQSGLLSQVKMYCNELKSYYKGVFLLKELSPRTTDAIIAHGELLSTIIFSGKLDALGIKHTLKDSRELISTNSDFGKAAVLLEKTQQNIKSYFSDKPKGLFILPGFIGRDKHEHTTTLGRGGSDYTASLLGSACEAKAVEIWTDVSGMMTADPSLVKGARIIHQISYREAMELSHFGAKVVYPQTIQPVMNKGIPVVVKNTFHPEDAGTRITDDPWQNGNRIRGISSLNKIALLSLEGSGMAGIPGFSRKLFEALAAQKINVILITQSSSEYSICVGIEEVHADRAREAVEEMFSYEIATQQVNEVVIERSLSILALVGDRMKNHPGISGRMLGALGRNGVNVRAIAQGSTERNISVVVAAPNVKKAINVLHEDFFEKSVKKINLFIIGTGNVGSKLLAQLQNQQEELESQLNLKICVAGLANSKRMVFEEPCLPLENWKEKLEQGEPMSLEGFRQRVVEKNLRNSVLVDVTANAEVGTSYQHFLSHSIAVVACNKVAASSPYTYYQELKKLSHEYQVPFFFETNVGAGLPVIGTLNDLLRSGDHVTRMEAVLSGTLNFVFNNYDGSRPFATVVRQAQDEGYTEPDPRLDLSGTDVVRKILILARETGVPLEMEDVKNQSFLPASCMEGDVDDFYRELEKQESYFKNLIAEPQRLGNKLKFVATFEKGRASVGLKPIDPDHDFYHLYGKDNAVLFYTNRYVEQPLVIKGAGAGAEVTASGVFADILRVAR